MDIIHLQPGEAPPRGSDSIRVDQTSGRCTMSGSVLVQGEPVFALGTFDTPEQAKFTAVRWAEGLGATRLYVEASDAEGFSQYRVRSVPG
jgi:hypothetical protein